MKQKKNFKKSERAITLIALIITIIVMIILVAVSINYTIKSELISKAKNGLEKQKVADTYERMMACIQETADGIDYKQTVKIIEEEFKYDENATISFNPNYENITNNTEKIKIEVNIKNEVYRYILSDHKIEELKIDLPEYIYTGAIVNYVPESSEITIASGEFGNGTSSSQKLTTEELNWKIMSFDRNTGVVILISDKPTTQKISLTGINGYAHGVDILNDVCEELYSKSGVGKARNLNLNDIMNYYQYTSLSQLAEESFGEVMTGNINAPTCYSKEIGSTNSGFNDKNLKDFSQGLSEKQISNGILSYKDSYSSEKVSVYTLGRISKVVTDNGFFDVGGSYLLSSRMHCAYKNLITNASFGMAEVTYSPKTTTKKASSTIALYQLVLQNNLNASLSMSYRPIVILEPGLKWESVAGGYKIST